MSNTRITVNEHIRRYVKYLWNKRIISFRTRDIQKLSERGEKVFGYRLGSPSTYDRQFRTMKEKGIINVKEVRTSSDSIWELLGINFKGGSK